MLNPQKVMNLGNWVKKTKISISAYHIMMQLENTRSQELKINCCECFEKKSDKSERKYKIVTKSDEH